MKLKPLELRTAHERIPDVRTAKRCVKAIQEYLQRHESPLAADDLAQSVKVLIDAERKRLQGEKS